LGAGLHARQPAGQAGAGDGRAGRQRHVARPAPAQTRANLDAILAELKKRGIPAMLTGMLAAPNLGAEYVAAFNPIWPSLAKKYDVPLVPFFLQPIFDKPALQLPDHMHPNAQGVDVLVAATEPQVARALAQALKTAR
jgi:acyl-CoA thioesterase-1